MPLTKILLLTGGVGGARLCDGFLQALPEVEWTIIANTGDDFEHLGLYVSPDIDSLVYTLAGIADPVRGWGLQNETWRTLEAIGRLGGETWFRLGDQDLATHILRTAALREGHALSAITARLSRALGIRADVRPMSDQPVRTLLDTPLGRLTFQDYFVRHRCEPACSAISFSGAEKARPPSDVIEKLHSGYFTAIVICPSNPFVSVGPMLSLPGFTEALTASSTPVLAVSPIIGGKAVKGPAAKMLGELGYLVDVRGIATYYHQRAPGLVNTLIVDDMDSHLAPAIEELGMRCLHTDILIDSSERRCRLANWVKAAIGDLQ